MTNHRFMEPEFSDTYKEFIAHLSDQELIAYEKEVEALDAKKEEVLKKYNDIVSENISRDAKYKFLKEIKACVDQKSIDYVNTLKTAYCFGLVSIDLFAVMFPETISSKGYYSEKKWEKWRHQRGKHHSNGDKCCDCLFEMYGYPEDGKDIADCVCWLAGHKDIRFSQEQMHSECEDSCKHETSDQPIKS